LEQIMRRRSMFGLIGLALLVGCNSGSVSGTVPVSGKVTYKGAPVEGAIVTFVPEGKGRTATATTRAGGVFSLTTVDASGAMPGKYKVTVDKVEYGPGGSSSMEAAASGNAAERQAKRVLPAKYAEAASTPLAMEIPTGGKKDIGLSLVD
jgi:carboxypeptidase family protein